MYLMFIRRQKVKRKSGTNIYYSIVKSTVGKKHPILKSIKYLGTAEKILEVFKFYEKNNTKK